MVNGCSTFVYWNILLVSCFYLCVFWVSALPNFNVVNLLLTSVISRHLLYRTLSSSSHVKLHSTILDTCCFHAVWCLKSCTTWDVSNFSILTWNDGNKEEQIRLDHAGWEQKSTEMLNRLLVIIGYPLRKQWSLDLSKKSWNQRKIRGFFSHVDIQSSLCVQKHSDIHWRSNLLVGYWILIRLL